MNKVLITLLKSINNGKISGAQRRLASLLGVSEVSVSSWINKNKKPSEDNIMKMAKIFKKSEEEVENIFIENYEKEVSTKNDNDQKLEEENKLLKERIKFLEEQVSFYKEKYSKLQK